MSTTRRLASFSLLVIILLCSACRRQPPAETRAQTGAEVVKAWQEYVTDLKSGDANRVSPHFTQDARLGEPNMPDLEGRTAIAQYVSKALSSRRVLDVTIEPRDVVPHGRLVFDIGSFTGSVQATGKGPVTVSGRYSAVWRRGGQGRLRLSFLMVSLTEPLPRE